MTVIRRRPDLLSAIALLAAAVAAPQLPALDSARAAETPPTIVVDLNRSKLVSLQRQPHKVIVGDPALLQVTVSPDGVTLTGLDLGETTMAVIDDGGAVVMKSTVRVESAAAPDIFVQRGLESRVYHCAPLCNLVSAASDGGGGGSSANARTSDSAAAQSTDANQTKPAGGKGL